MAKANSTRARKAQLQTTPKPRAGKAGSASPLEELVAGQLQRVIDKHGVIALSKSLCALQTRLYTAKNLTALASSHAFTKHEEDIDLWRGLKEICVMLEAEADWFGGDMGATAVHS